jgi:transcriptional regulator with XRE-family HTH domain
MQRRLKQLRLSFGLYPEAMDALLGFSHSQWSRWESGGQAPSVAELAAVADRLGLNPEWLGGADVPMWGQRVAGLRRQVARQIKRLSGLALIEVAAATTGERIAYVLGLMQAEAPELLSLDVVAAWLGLSPGSTELLLKGQLSASTAVVARASDLTGILERWFRVGPEMERGAP